MVYRHVAITLISAFLAGYFVHEYLKWKEEATYWFQQYEEVKKANELQKQPEQVKKRMCIKKYAAIKGDNQDFEM